MHEMALAQGILAVVLDVAEDQRVQRVRLRVGALQRVVPDSLQFSFELLAAETVAAEAKLEIEPVGARIKCTHCQTISEVDEALLWCRHCGGAEVTILAGDELVIDAVQRQSGWRRRPARWAAARVTMAHLQGHVIEERGWDGVPEAFSRWIAEGA